MATETKPFDPIEGLINEQRIAVYLEEAFADGDPALIISAIGDLARACNITAVARDTGTAREALYQAVSP